MLDPPETRRPGVTRTPKLREPCGVPAIPHPTGPIYPEMSPAVGILEAMGHIVHFPPAASPDPSPGHPVRHVPSVAGAVEAYFANRDLAAETRRTYRKALYPLVEALDDDNRPVTDLDPDLVAAVFTARWDGCAPATWNTRRVAVQAFATWCDERWPLAADPLAAVPPRRRQADNTRAIPLEDLEELWRRRTVPLREKTLWRMLYETAARASEVLALDVEDLDRARRRARIRSKGGSTDMVVWAAPTARLLGRYVAGRDAGPLFLTRWRTRTAPARCDLCQPTGQAWLSYWTAAAEFRKHSGGVDPPPAATRVPHASGRGGGLGGDAAGEEPASGPERLVGVHEAWGGGSCPAHSGAVDGLTC